MRKLGVITLVAPSLRWAGWGNIIMESVTRRAAIGSAMCAIVSTAVVALPAVGTEADPIFGLIEAHKRLWTEYLTSIHEQTALEDELPIEDCVSGNEHARLVACQLRGRRAVDAADAVAWRLIDEPAVTVAGVGALLMYACDFVDRGNQWPDGRRGDDDHDWKAELICSAGRVLMAMSVSAG